MSTLERIEVVAERLVELGAALGVGEPLLDGLEVGEEIPELSTDDRGGEIGEALSFDCGDHPAIDLDGTEFSYATAPSPARAAG